MDLEHPNARVRDLARRILAEQRRHAEERVRMRDEDEALGETLGGTPGARTSDAGETTTRERDRSQNHGDDDPF